jgi:hypothetical protein
MVCALTVRKLKPGTFDEFHRAFLDLVDPGVPPGGFVRFDMLRNVDDPDEVITFGFFDGTVDEIREQSTEMGRNTQQQAIAPFVESVGADGLYEVIEERIAP